MHRLTDQTQWADGRARDLFTYEMITLRALEQDSMTWQTPALAMTAQAFLMNLALAPDTGAAAKLIAAGLGVVITVLSMQLMARHRHLRKLDEAELRRLERHLDLSAVVDRRWSARAGRASPADSDPQPGRWAGMASSQLWFRGLGLFGIANLGVIASAGIDLLKS